MSFVSKLPSVIIRMIAVVIRLLVLHTFYSNYIYHPHRSFFILSDHFQQTPGLLADFQLFPDFQKIYMYKSQCVMLCSSKMTFERMNSFKLQTRGNISLAPRSSASALVNHADPVVF